MVRRASWPGKGTVMLKNQLRRIQPQTTTKASWPHNRHPIVGPNVASHPIFTFLGLASSWRSTRCENRIPVGISTLLLDARTCQYRHGSHHEMAEERVE